MISALAILGWMLAIFGWSGWHITQMELRRVEAARRASERECARVREVGLRTVEMWHASDRARAEGKSVNEALRPFLARPIASPEAEASRR